MTTTITQGSTTFTPTLTGYSGSHESGNIIHVLPGTTSPGVTLGDSSLRTGTLQLAFAAESDSAAAESAFMIGAPFTLSDTTFPSVDMTFVTTSEIVRELDSETLNGWTVTFSYQEVTS